MFKREENVFADYDSVWKGYTRHAGKNGGWYDLYKNPPDDWETKNKSAVEALIENGHKIKVIPKLENIKPKYKVEWSNPDIIFNGHLADIKTVETSITSRLKSAKEQKVKYCILVVPDTFSEEQIEEAFNSWSHGRLNVIMIYKGIIRNISLK